MATWVKRAIDACGLPASWCAWARRCFRFSHCPPCDPLPLGAGGAAAGAAAFAAGAAVATTAGAAAGGGAAGAAAPGAAGAAAPAAGAAAFLATALTGVRVTEVAGAGDFLAVMTGSFGVVVVVAVASSSVV